MIAFDASSTYARVTGVTSKTFAHTCTGANLVLLVCVATESGDTVTGVTYNGVAMTQLVKKERSPGDGQWVYWYRLVAPATGANNVVVSFSGATNTVGGAVSYTGAKQTGLPDATNSSSVNNSSTASSTFQVTSTVDNCWAVYAFHAVGTGGSTVTATIGSGGTMRQEDSQPALRIADSNAVITPAGTHSLAVNYSANAFFIIQVAVSLAPYIPNQTLTETVTLTESLLKQGQKVLSQTITAADTILKRAGKVLSENPTFTEVFTGLRVKVATFLERLNVSNGSYALAFDGTLTNQVSATNPYGASQTTATTVSIVRLSDLVARHNIYYRAFGNTQYPRLRVDTDGMIHIQFRIDGVTHQAFSAAAAASPNTILVIIVTFDVASATTIYLNGTQIAQDLAAGTAYDGGSSALLMGRDSNLVTALKGTFFKQLFYSRVLTAQEIADASTYTFPASGLVAAYEFDEGTGSTTYDRTAGAKHGTITGATWTTGLTSYLGIAKSLIRTLTENTTLTDTVPRSIQRLFSEAASITDSLLKVPGKILSEAVTLADTFLRTIVRTFSETATLTQSFLKSTARTLSQTLTIADTFTRVITYIRTFTESLSITEFIRSYLNGLNSRYSPKYEDQGTTYTEKYPEKGTQYEKKYPS
jgi:hypothetical protein